MKKKWAIFLFILFIAFETKVEAAGNTNNSYKNSSQNICTTCHCYPCRCVSSCYPDPVAVPPCAPCPPPCPPPNPCFPCDPCAPVCGTQCGLTVCAVGAAVVAIGIVAAIIISTGRGSNVHAANEANQIVPIIQ